jgi:hypothetical protein
VVNRIVTTALDVTGLLLLAAGFAGAVWPLIEWASLGVAGVVVLMGSWFADRENRHKDMDQ